MSLLYFCLFIAVIQGAYGFVGLGFHFENFPQDDRNLVVFKDTDECMNMSMTLSQVYQFSRNVSSWVYQSSQVISKDFVDLFSCSGYGAVPCILDALSKTRTDLFGLKPSLDTLEGEAADLFANLKKEFSACLMSRVTSICLGMMQEISHSLKNEKTNVKQLELFGRQYPKRLIFH